MNKDIPVGKKMTDKEKIAQIIAEHLCSQGKSHKRLYGSERMCYSRNNFAECEKVSKCVDALIAAGIGDVKEAERRAEVAEKYLERHKRALYCACKASATVVTKELVKARVDCFLRKAEKELAEERKDDRERNNTKNI